MTRLLRFGLALILGSLLLVPEWRAYRAEAHVLQANLLIAAALSGTLPDQDPLQGVQRMLVHAKYAQVGLPYDPRPVLAEGVGLMMLSKLDAAEQVLVAAIRFGERPEILVNYGRVLGGRGDHVQAHAAMLRAAFVAPGSVQTLPESMRQQIFSEVADFERAFVRGDQPEPPPLPNTPALRAAMVGLEPPEWPLPTAIAAPETNR